MSDTLLSIAAGILTAIASVAVSWGMMQSRIDRLEKDQLELKERQEHFEDHYVDNKQFESVIKPIQDGMREVQRDIKKILMMLSRNEPSR